MLTLLQKWIFHSYCSETRRGDILTRPGVCAATGGILTAALHCDNVTNIILIKDYFTATWRIQSMSIRHKPYFVSPYSYQTCVRRLSRLLKVIWAGFSNVVLFISSNLKLIILTASGMTLNLSSWVTALKVAVESSLCDTRLDSLRTLLRTFIIMTILDQKASQVFFSPSIAWCKWILIRNYFILWTGMIWINLV